MRRAAISIPANIAEGFKKKGLKDKMRYLNIAQGSLEEVKYYLILANDLHYGDFRQLKYESEEISKMLDAYLKTIAKQLLTPDS